MATEIQTDVISVQISAYASRLADFIISKLVGDVNDQHNAAKQVILLLDNEFTTVSELAGSLAFNAIDSSIYEVWVSNYFNTIRTYKNRLSSTEYEALYTYASSYGDFEITAEEVTNAVREAAYDLYGELEY